MLPKTVLAFLLAGNALVRGLAVVKRTVDVSKSRQRVADAHSIVSENVACRLKLLRSSIFGRASFKRIYSGLD